MDGIHSEVNIEDRRLERKIPQRVRSILEKEGATQFVKDMVIGHVLGQEDPEERMLEFMLIYEAARAVYKQHHAEQLAREGQS